MSNVIAMPLPPLTNDAILGIQNAIRWVITDMDYKAPEQRDELRAAWAARLRDAAQKLYPQQEKLHNDSGGALNIEKRADGYHISVGINEAKAMALINSMADKRQQLPIVREDGSLLHAHPPRLVWIPTETKMALDGEFNDVQLRALAWWTGERKR